MSSVERALVTAAGATGSPVAIVAAPAGGRGFYTYDQAGNRVGKGI